MWRATVAARIIIGIFVLFLIVYIGFDFALNRNLPSLGFGEANDQNGRLHPSSIDVILSVFAMLLGLLFGAIYEQIRSTNGHISIGSEVAKAVQSASFFRSLLVSPLVFAGVYAAAGTQTDLLVAVIFAFQNGFFCETIFREKHSQS